MLVNSQKTQTDSKKPILAQCGILSLFLNFWQCAKKYVLCQVLQKIKTNIKDNFQCFRIDRKEKCQCDLFWVSQPLLSKKFAFGCIDI